MQSQEAVKGRVTYGTGVTGRRLRMPLLRANGGPLRILIYARYSTEEQNPRSIQDQFGYCRHLLEREKLSDYSIETESDAEISGEHVSRPGIDRVREGIAGRNWDAILCEDASRLYRHHTAGMQIVEAAVDHDIRVIAINDNIDTAEDDWDDRLHEALRDHVKANRYTRKRILRAMTGLWESRAAVGLLRPGYVRKPTHPATEKEPESGPFFDDVDDQWAPIVLQAFERIARNDLPWDVANFLTEKRLPKCHNATRTDWSDRNVIALIRRALYRGLETYHATQIKKNRTKGVGKQVRSHDDEVWRRDMEHLRIVPDHLWYAANSAIDRRCNHAPSANGVEHPLSGIPRDSRGPLSGIFVCGICNAKMYREGRAEGGYRCSAAPEGRCWNKATATTKDVHDQISNALSAEMPRAFKRLSTAIECLRGVLGDDAPLQAKLEEQRKRVVDLNDIRERLADAVVSGKWSSGTTPSILIERLTINENEKVIAEAELQRLQSLKAMPSRIPTADDLRNLIDDASSCLAKMDRQAGALLRRLTSRVAAIPYQQFDSNKVVLRARFELDLLQLLPAHVLVYFEKEIVKRDVVPGEVEFLVNLFLPSAGPLHFATALAMSKDGETLNAIGKVLGVSKRTAHIAVQYGRNMQAAELTDAYRELTERPVAASRWRFIRRSANSPLI